MAITTEFQFPPIPVYLLQTHLPEDVLHELEDQIPNLTYDAKEAKLFLGKVTTKQRAAFELRSKGIWCEEVVRQSAVAPGDSEPPQKRRRKESETEEEAVIVDRDSQGQPEVDWGDTIKVVRLAWFQDCVKEKKLLSLDDYLVFEGKRIEKPTGASNAKKHDSTSTQPKASTYEKAVSTTIPPSHQPGSGHRKPDHGSVTRPTHLLHETTSEHEEAAHLPPLPAYLETPYACERPTPLHSPNDGFIDALKKMRTVRDLLGEETGVRAYSTSIAVIAAYPYAIKSPGEILRLPGCDHKIASLFQQWKDTGHLSEADGLETDSKLKALFLFYNIWGVNTATAQKFYNQGWRDLDDVVEYGWASLTRVQQIGVKFYDDFAKPIPKSEVESIADVIISHARRINPGFEICIVGGYRRGKEQSGDVDVVLSHRDEEATLGFIEDLVQALEDAEYITHTLSLSTANSERGQKPVAWKGVNPKAGSGFDTLDKALVAWQYPDFPKEYDEQGNEKKKKNPNTHRRVDIIISPWKTVGCAVAGWTSGTTFQRDLRRYCKARLNAKFDSSGVRSRIDGSWIDLEGERVVTWKDKELVISDPVRGKAETMIEAEKRMFEGLGLGYREPSERCTG